MSPPASAYSLAPIEGNLFASASVAIARKLAANSPCGALRGHLPGTRGGRWRLKEFRAADSTRPGNRPPRSPCPRTGSFHSDGLIGRDARTCLYRKLDSAIMVMKSAEDGRRYNVAHVPDGAMDRGVLVERPMSPQLIIVGGITMFRPSGGTFHSGWGCNVRPKRHAVTASGRLPAMIRCANSLSSASPACASAAHSATKSTTSPAPTACRGRHEPPALGRAPRRKNIWAL